MQQHILEICYLIASVTFILGLKYLGNPATARKGNLIAAFGMTLAIFATIFLYKDASGQHLRNLPFIFGGLLVGTVLGWLAAKKVQMTAMPEMVSLFNGMGGACAMLISIIEFQHIQHATNNELVAASVMMVPPTGELATIIIGMVIGSVSFAGSIIAWGKLSGKVKDKSFGMQQLINIGLLLVIMVLAVWSVSTFDATLFYAVLGLSLLYGVLFVLPIGGAACLSTHWPGSVYRNTTKVPDLFMQYTASHLPADTKHRFYFDRGTATLDSWYTYGHNSMNALASSLKLKENQYQSLIFEGADHSEKAWQKRLEIPLRFLLSK